MSSDERNKIRQQIRNEAMANGWTYDQMQAAQVERGVAELYRPTKTMTGGKIPRTIRRKPPVAYYAPVIHIYLKGSEVTS